MSEQGTPKTWTRVELPSALQRGLAAAVDRGAKAPVILRLTEVAGYTDWALLISARSERQVHGIVDAIIGAAQGGDAKLIGSDGLDLYLWALLDYDDFLVHVFYHPVRRFYDLESMWSDAPRVELGLSAEVMDDTDLDGLVAPDPMPSYRGDLAFGGFEDEFVDDDDSDESDEDPDFVDDDLFDEDPPVSPTADSEARANPDDDLFDS
jgi:ribosome-associated protein